MRALGSLTRAPGSLTRALGSLTRVYGSLRRAYGSLRRAWYTAPHNMSHFTISSSTSTCSTVVSDHSSNSVTSDTDDDILDDDIVDEEEITSVPTSNDKVRRTRFTLQHKIIDWQHKHQKHELQRLKSELSKKRKYTTAMETKVARLEATLAEAYAEVKYVNSSKRQKVKQLSEKNKVLLQNRIDTSNKLKMEQKKHRTMKSNMEKKLEEHENTIRDLKTKLDELKKSQMSVILTQKHRALLTQLQRVSDLENEKASLQREVQRLQESEQRRRELEHEKASLWSEVQNLVQTQHDKLASSENAMTTQFHAMKFLFDIQQLIPVAPTNE